MKNTTKLLNSYIASLLVWNVKLHNIHWNVTGHLGVCRFLCLARVYG